MHVHHNEYGLNPWDIENDKLITYCEHCHRFVEITKNFKNYTKIIKIIKRKSNNGIILYCFIIDELNDKWVIINSLNPEIYDDIKFIINTNNKNLPNGFILGKAKLVDVKKYNSKEEFEKDKDKHLASEEFGNFGFILSDIQRISLIPAKGSLNFWNFEIKL